MRSSNLLSFLIFLYIQFLKLYLTNLNIVSNIILEQAQYSRWERFSFIEAYAIQRTVKQFKDYRFDAIYFETSLGDVHIVFVDESAYLHFDFETEVFARLDYDLVYDSALAYDIIPEALVPSVDKISH